MAIMLVKTLTRKITSDARAIRRKLKKGKTVPYTVELHWEPGEVLITLLMDDAQVKTAVDEALTQALSPTKGFKATNVGYGDNLIWFTIEPSP